MVGGERGLEREVLPRAALPASSASPLVPSEEGLWVFSPREWERYREFRFQRLV